jgi:hypothetical protein
MKTGAGEGGFVNRHDTPKMSQPARVGLTPTLVFASMKDTSNLVTPMACNAIDVISSAKMLGIRNGVSSQRFDPTTRSKKPSFVCPSCCDITSSAGVNLGVSPS